MKVALVHDFLTQLGGAERVLECFHELFPQAPVYTLVYDEDKTGGRFRNYDIRSSFLQKLPGGIKRYKWYLPLMRRAVESMDLSGFDLVLSDASAFAKGVKTNARHISYIHSPTRYLWLETDEYVRNSSAPMLLKPFLKMYLKKVLRPWDRAAAQRPDALIANSKTVQDRIKKYYGRDSEIVYPPVDTGEFRPQGEKQDYFLTASRLEPYKKIELVIEAFRELDLPLKVIGGGSTGLSIQSQISKSKNVEYLGKVDDSELSSLMAGARAFVFPALEDAGIMVLEALSSGTPVIGYNKGGTAEFVRDSENGVLFERQSAQAIREAVERFGGLSFDEDRIRATALPYDKKEFKKQISDLVRDRLNS